MASRRTSEPEYTQSTKQGRRAAAKSTVAEATQAVLAATAVPGIAAEERRALIARAAYLRGECRGFPAGGETEDWLVAEKEVDALLGGSYRAAQ